MQTKHHLVFFTGSGISQESGIPTFRKKDGTWSQHNIEEVASLAGFEQNPQKVLDFYNKRRQQLDEVAPNLAHKLIASLEDRYKVSVITQNIDDLHERAGSSKVLHLHGELRKCRSSKNPQLLYPYKQDLKPGDLCEEGSQLRPHVVWFGEEVTMLEEAISVSQTADLFIIIGTTMMVQPAASLLLTVPVDAQTVYIDIDPDVEDGINLLVLKEKASSGMERLVNELLPY